MKNRHATSGFSLIELLVVIAIIAILAAIAVPVYRQYIIKAEVADYLSNYDTMKTKVATFYEEKGDCNNVLQALDRDALQSRYAALDIGFEHVAEGHTPFLRLCAEVSTHGTMGIQVAAAAHDAFAEKGLVLPGAVIGQSMVNFAVPLAPGGTPVCTDNRYTPVLGQGCGAQRLAGMTPSKPADTPPPKATMPVPTAQPVLEPQCRPPERQMIDRHVMTFGGDLTGHVMNTGDLDTGGPMRQFSAEVAIVGGQQIAASGNHGATMLSYATHDDSNAFIMWNPANVNIQFGPQNIATGVNVNDGQNHRISVTWDSDTGQLLLFDNGQQVWSGTVNQGGTLGGDGKLVLGQDQDSYGGGFNKNDAYQGQIVTASLARAVAPPERLAAGPLHTALTPETGLITNVVMGENGPVDTTGRHTYTGGGDMQRVTQPVDSGLYVTSDCK